MHHGVRITDGAIVSAAVYSHRYITDRFLPDKVQAFPRSLHFGRSVVNTLVVHLHIVGDRSGGRSGQQVEAAAGEQA